MDYGFFVYFEGEKIVYLDVFVFFCDIGLVDGFFGFFINVFGCEIVEGVFIGWYNGGWGNWV